MYNKAEASAVRQKFWTQFGKYMQPVPSAGGEKINWLNYRTGSKDVIIKTDADNNEAMISISFYNDGSGSDAYSKFLALEDEFNSMAGDDWEHEKTGAQQVRVQKKLIRVNIFRESDWPAIISFLKTNLIALDAFWQENQDVFTLS